ncbi:MAG TPA: TolC family protein [Thermoanaerobaculia bacterium]|nr:TolC family protein [Thermoanaerobaculia bacterium]
MKHPLVFLGIAVLCATGAWAQQAPLTLQEAVQLALTRNETAAIAESAVEAADARLRLARTAFLPRLDINGSARRDFESNDSSTIATSALLTQPLFNARVFPLYRQARLLREAAGYDATEARRLLGFDAATQFLSTLSFEQVLLAAEHRRDFANTNLADVRARFEAGLVSSNDVTRAELELATAERGVAEARGDVQVARIALATIVNADVPETLAVPEALLQEAANTPAVDATAIAGAQQRRTDIAATRARIEALRAFAEEPNARFLPSVLFNAQTANINDGPVTNRNNEGFFGVSLAWPVFDAGVRSAERAERTAEVRGAEFQLQQTLRTVEREIRGNAVQLATEQAALVQAAAALRAARKNADETTELYRQGLATALELADANQSLFEAEVAEVTARFRMAVAYLALREASGGEAVERS